MALSIWSSSLHPTALNGLKMRGSAALRWRASRCATLMTSLRAKPQRTDRKTVNPFHDCAPSASIGCNIDRSGEEDWIKNCRSSLASEEAADDCAPLQNLRSCLALSIT